MKFVGFEEYNDHEGETWMFWLQLDGNEDELAKLKSNIDKENAESECYFSLDMNPIDESEVDILVKHARGSYMSSDNKVVGKLELPEVDENPSDEYYDWFNDNFYKGDIERWFK